jgi:hypothetical protein
MPHVDIFVWSFNAYGDYSKRVAECGGALFAAVTVGVLEYLQNPLKSVANSTLKAADKLTSMFLHLTNYHTNLDLVRHFVNIDAVSYDQSAHSSSPEKA